MGRRTLPLLLGALVLLASACGQRQEPLGELPQTYPVTVAGAGEASTTLAAAPERIAALDSGSAELVAHLGAGGRLVGVPAGFRAEGVEDAREVVHANGQILVDALVGLEPDLIVATPASDPLDVARAGRESEAALYVQPAASIADIERGAVELGFLIGRAPEARRLVGSIRDDVARVEARVAAVETVTVFVDTGFFITVPERSLLGSLVRLAKGESVAGANPGPDPFPLRRLAALDPAVYLTTSGSRVQLSDLRRNAATRELGAVRRGRFAILPEALVTRPGPRVGEGLEAVARALHPDAFPD